MATATTERARRLWARRVGWLLLIWAASVGALFVAAWLLRLLMAMVGLSR